MLAVMRCNAKYVYFLIFACDRKKNSSVVTVEIETYGSLGSRGHIRATTDIT